LGRDDHNAFSDKNVAWSLALCVKVQRHLPSAFRARKSLEKDLAQIIDQALAGAESARPDAAAPSHIMQETTPRSYQKMRYDRRGPNLPVHRQTGCERGFLSFLS